jgi:hypothetical protein
MKEDFLHYVWRYRKFDHTDLKTTQGEPVTILNPGQYLQLAGPDFFNAQIIIADQKWAGNIEIHVNSSDWYLHNHQSDEAYENVILHVVWQHDADILRINNLEIPVLELSHYVASKTLDNYNNLTTVKSWIFCERQLKQIPDITLLQWKEVLFIERLERKCDPIMFLLDETRGDWEATLFSLLARNFGLNTNGNSFYEAARQIPFSVILKEQAVPIHIESILFGMAGLLAGHHEDVYFNELKRTFTYLVEKHKLHVSTVTPLQFFKHRPDNFPTIRLSQFAALYSGKVNLFSSISELADIKKFYEIFDVSASEYWQTHYLFDRPSRASPRKPGRSFIDLLIINTIIPVQFAYARSRGRQNFEDLAELLQQLKAERNSIVLKFEEHGLEVGNAFDSQALLQLRNEYCSKARCLQCAIGMELLKS